MQYPFLEHRVVRRFRGASENKSPMKYICVYCGSSPGKNSAYIEAAQSLGKSLVENNIGLIYGGASVGTMGALANTVLDCGGEVIGIMPQSLVDKEVSHMGLTELKVVTSMHERKALMCDLADGFIALPGGFGTLDELFEMLTWSQLGYHHKPIGLLNVNHYFDYLNSFIKHAVEEHFIKPIHRDMILVSVDANQLTEQLLKHRPPKADKWMKNESD